MIAPIPKSLMPDTITVKCPIVGDFGGKFEEPLVIMNVRYDQATSLTRSGYVFEDGSKGLIFIDAVNSQGAFEVPVGSLIYLNGEELAVVKVTPYETFNGRMHHWEVEVA